MRRLLRWLGRILAGFLAVCALAAALLAVALWRTVPPSTMDAALPGLSEPVQVALDPSGIPWIRAGSDEDAAAALGFLHARDRMFQMEMMRRAASGRLSELVGPATLPIDRALRTLGLRRRAEAELPALDAATRAMLEAYARGVNAWIARRGRFAAPEFLPFGAPEPWTALDSLLWGKTMALYLAGDWRLELERTALAARLSPTLQRLLWPDWPGTLPPTAALQTDLARLVPAFPDPFTLPDQASNEWAVDGAHSATGAPLLAGDPHLGLTFPSTWYLARIDTPSGTLAGATAPGVPFLVLGRNAHVAWTFTTTGADTQDVFIETKLPGDTYATPDGPRPFQTREERIHVRGAPDEIITVRETRHGPVMSDLERKREGPLLAVAMAALQAQDTAATGLLALNRAADLEAAHRAAAQISAPVQNLLVADRAHIGLFTTGRIPLRREGGGAIAVSGADGTHDWLRLAGGDDLPHFTDPASGRLVNANERTVGPEFPVPLGAESFGDWRSRRIRALLDARPKPDAGAFAAMQVDVGSAFVDEVRPALLGTSPADEASRQWLERLRGWDGRMTMDRAEPLVFNAWMRRYFAALMAKLELGRARVGPMIDIVAESLRPGGGPLCGGDCAPLLTRSLADTVASLGASPPDWGAVHQAAFAHPILGRLPILGPLFTWRIPQPGDDSTLFRGTPALNGDWTSLHGPAYRGVYDLAEPDRSLFAIAPGQSGNPFSAAASSTLAAWRDGKALRLGPSPSEIAGRITLHP